MSFYNLENLSEVFQSNYHYKDVNSFVHYFIYFILFYFIFSGKETKKKKKKKKKKNLKI